MTDYLLLFVGTVLVNNFVLVKFLGLCPFMGVSKKLETAMGMGLATTFVMTLASICAWLIDTWILIPLNLIYLRTLAFILVIAVVVQFTYPFNDFPDVFHAGFGLFGRVASVF